MPTAAVNGVELYYEVSGDGFPVIFSHEFAGDYRAWDPQVRALNRLYRCVTYNHRGFPPSSVPTDPAAYSQDLLIEDLRALVVDALGLQQAYFIGFSMGGNVVLNLALRYPELCKAAVVVGTGSGSTNRERFEQDIDRVVSTLRTSGIEAFASVYAEGPTRQPFKRKDPHGWRVFRQQLADHSAEGQALTMLGVLRPRPTIFALETALQHLRVPVLLMTGDEDEPCVDPAVFMKRQIPTAGLHVVPQTGHAINLEEPAIFNRAVLDFFRLVEADRWPIRAAVSTSLLPEPAAVQRSG